MVTIKQRESDARDSALLTQLPSPCLPSLTATHSHSLNSLTYSLTHRCLYLRGLAEEAREDVIELI